VKYAANIDKNQTEIVRGLQAAGFAVISLHRMGEGVPDILVSSRQEIWLVEIKNPENRNNQKRHKGLNQRHRRFHELWKGKPIIIATNLEDLLKELI